MLVGGKDVVLAIADCAKISSICGVAQLSTICMSWLAHSRFLLSIRTSLEFLDRRSSTTLLVSSRTERLDLLGLEEPEDEILEQPDAHLPMHGRQRASRDGGGTKPLLDAEDA